jgi:hypothetical protein
MAGGQICYYKTLVLTIQIRDLRIYETTGIRIQNFFFFYKSGLLFPADMEQIYLFPARIKIQKNTLGGNLIRIFVVTDNEEGRIPTSNFHTRKEVFFQILYQVYRDCTSLLATGIPGAHVCLHPLEHGEGFLLRRIRLILHVSQRFHRQVAHVVTAEKLGICSP